MTPYIANSARKHGVSDEDMIHAYRLPIKIWPEVDDGLDMFVGPARTGTILLEVGVVTADDATPVIVHAMKARSKSCLRGDAHAP